MTSNTASRTSSHIIWLQACGIFLCAIVSLATLDVIAKDLVARHPAPLVNLVRYSMVLIMAIALMHQRGTKWKLPAAHRRTVFWRGVMLGTVGLSFMQALHTMPLAEATAIYFLSPLLVVALSPFMLGEQVRRPQAVAVIAGFVGMLLIVRPGGTLPLAGTILMLMAAGAYAMLQLLTRRLAGKVTMEQQFAWTALVCTIMTLLSLPTASHLNWPGSFDLAMMILVGALSGFGQYLLIEAFHRVPASSLAPFNYFHLLLAVIFSVVFFGQQPDALALVGIAVIACSGLALTLPLFRAQWLNMQASREM